MTRVVVVALCSLFCVQGILAQDTLPKFTAVAKPNNRNVISWTNPYTTVSQISIQRSNDSLKNFKSILMVPDPLVPQNGFVDTKAPAGVNFYRLFIVFDGGKYQFSKSRRPAPDTATSGSNGETAPNQRVVLDNLSNKEVSALKEKLQPGSSTSPVKTEKLLVVKRRGLVINRIPEKLLKKFKDSIVYTTRDTLVFESVDIIVIKPYVAGEMYKASKYVYAERYGNVTIDLPEIESKKYSIKFFEENKTPLFEIKEVLSPSLVIDKTNFVHSGWFWFELYEDGKLKERNKFFIPKDF